MIDQQRLLNVFQKRFGIAPGLLGRAPGRVNLIGEHTDYNGGLVLPAAINREVAVAFAPRSDDRVRLFSVDFKEMHEFDAGALIPISKRAAGWANYVVAVIEQIRTQGTSVSGFDAAITGDVPAGAGLSSSAALEMAVGIGLCALWNQSLPKERLALLGQAAEHSDYVGVQSGIMDQFVSALGQADHALLLDCASLACESVPLPGNRAAILIVNSMVRRGLVDSEYNRRRAECAEGLAQLEKLENRHFDTLRHAGLAVFEAHASALPEKVCRRVRHVVTENERVLATVEALRHGNLADVGRLFVESHESLRDDYQVSCPPVDRLCELLIETHGVYGARMTGAGFGGCVVALVDPASVEGIAEDVARRYEEETGKRPDTFVTPACEGARTLSLEGTER